MKHVQFAKQSFGEEKEMVDLVERRRSRQLAQLQFLENIYWYQFFGWKRVEHPVLLASTDQQQSLSDFPSAYSLEQMSELKHWVHHA